MAANSRAIDAAEMTVKDLLKANQGRKALCATMRVLKSVKRLTIKDRAKLCRMAKSCACELYVNIMTGRFSEDDGKSLASLFQTRRLLLFYGIPVWFQQVIDDDTNLCNCDFCRPEEKEMRKTQYISAMLFILDRMSIHMDEDTHRSCFEDLEDVIGVLGISTAIAPLEQFFSLFYGFCLPTDQSSKYARNFRKGARDILNFCTRQSRCWTIVTTRRR
jgi:hypothetical protein